MSAALARLVPLDAWRAALLALLTTLVALLALYGPTFLSMAQIWARSDTYAHGFLVAPIAAWLVWRQGGRLRELDPSPAPLLLLPMAAFALAWLLADLAGVNAAVHFAATGLLVLAVPALLGLRVAGAIAFPLGFLFFMVPFGEFTTPTMMEWTADVTVGFLRLVGIPVYREGMQFMIPSGAWSVIEACSGVRYLIASFMAGTLFAYLSYSSTRKRLMFAAFALLVPVVANWLRAIIIVMLGHLTDNRLAAGVDHLVYGWVFFGIVIAVMFYVGSRWADAPAKPAPSLAAIHDKEGGRTAAADSGPSAVAWVGSTALALAVLALPHVAAWRVDGGPRPGIVLALPALPGATHPDGSASTSRPGSDVFPEPVFIHPRAVAERLYATPAGPVQVHVAYYVQQSYDRKLVNSQNMLVRSDDPGWSMVSDGTTRLVVDGTEIEVRRAALRRGGIDRATSARRLQVRQVLWVDGRLLIGPRTALLAALQSRLAGRGDHAAAITFMHSGADPTADDATLDAFVQRHLGTIVLTLDAARRGSAPP